jgi:hypothetical protein
MATETLTMAGYRATRDAAGVLTVHDVPIFVECSRGKHEFDAEWIDAAVAKSKLSAAESYFPPLHVRHHKDGAEVKAAGFFRITGTQRITFRGEARLAVVADLVITDRAVAADVLAKRYPYRSVEIFNVGTPALDSLALLDHEAPFLELPMLMVSRVDESAPIASATMDQAAGSTVAAIFRRGRSAALLFQMDENAATQATNQDAPPIPGQDQTKDAGTDPKVAAIVASIADGSISVAGLQQIIDAIKARTGDTDGDAVADANQPPAAGNAPAKAPSPGSGRASMKKEDMDTNTNEIATMKAEAAADLTVQMAKLAGELEAERAKNAEFRAESIRKDQVAAAMKRLEGRPLGADLQDKLVAFHKTHGEAAFAAYVDAFATSVGPVSRDSATAIAMKADKLPEVAAKYESQGADAVRRAVQFSKEWDELTAHRATSLSRDRYVEVHMGLANRSN